MHMCRWRSSWAVLYFSLSRVQSVTPAMAVTALSELLCSISDAKVHAWQHCQLRTELTGGIGTADLALMCGSMCSFRLKLHT